MKRLDQITLRQLRALFTVVETGNISTAAETLGLTGPAIHNQLKSLEETVGAPLLVREGRWRNSPTEQGKVLIATYAEMRASIERAILNLNAIERGQKGTVVLGAVSTAKYFAPRIVALLQNEMPEIEVVLKIANRAATIDALSQGAFDLCIMGRPPRDPRFEALPLVDHPHIFIAAADHPLASEPLVCPDRLFAERIVLREPGSGTRILATRFLDDFGKGRDANTVEMGSNETIKQAVLSRLGVALISAHTVAEQLESGTLVALKVPGTPVVRKWYLLAPSDGPGSTAAGRVRDWLLSDPQRYFPRYQAT